MEIHVPPGRSTSAVRSVSSGPLTTSSAPSRGCANIRGQRRSCTGSNTEPTHLANVTRVSVAHPLPVLYQAEWCPFSSAVREVLTELGVDFVAHQVQPWPEQRAELRQLANTDQIPVLQTEDGRLFRGTREIFAHLHERDPWQFAAAHRRRFAAHRDARESDATGQLIEYFRGTDELEVAAGSVAEAEVLDVPQASR